MATDKRVLVACGTSIATATVVAEKVKEIAREAGIRVNVAQCKASEVRGRAMVFGPNLILTTTPIPEDLDCPVLSGIPFLSGIGMDDLKAKVLKEISKE
jgi:PTS system galactitol-specific IIB component